MLTLLKNLDEQIAATEDKLKNALTHEPQRLIWENQLIVMQALRELLRR